MRGYKTKEDKASEVQANTPKSKEKHSKDTLKVAMLFLIVLALGVCAIIGYNHKVIDNHFDNENADSVVTDSVVVDIALADSVSEETIITDVEKAERMIGVHNGHEWIDLGLSVRWATCNIGAHAYYEYGNYFTWGDINSIKPDEYCKTFDEEIYDIAGIKEYDAALYHWGGQWRLPTKAEFEELIEKCTIKEKVVGKYNGCLVTGPNGNSIFLPLAGLSGNGEFDDESVGKEGQYWTATSNDKERAYYLEIEYGNVLRVCSVGRFYGYTIRPVYDNKERIGFDDL